MSRAAEVPAPTDPWPELDYAAWSDTCSTLHLWTQIVGKLRVARVPWINHGWHVTLQVTSRGLTTGPIPHGDRDFQVELDFIDHALRATVSDGARAEIALQPMPVAVFYRLLMAQLDDLGVPVSIHGSPNEVTEPIPFARDEVHGAYDPGYVNRFFRALASSARVLQDFRGEFIGKCSPVHFFWGGFDLAVTRFSGRRAPLHPGGVTNLPDWITREAYSHEVSSAGFWPGGERYPHPMFYSYAYPQPPGIADGKVEPEGATWDESLAEFVLPYDTIRRSAEPGQDLLRFLRSTYAAAADPAGWDRDALEWPPGGRPVALRPAVKPR